MTAITRFTPISEERKAELTAKGYFIEDMGEEYGAEYEGQFRWMNLDGSFQDLDPSDNAEEAWADAHVWETKNL